MKETIGLVRVVAKADCRFVAVLRLAGELGVQITAAALRSALARGAAEPADVRLAQRKAYVCASAEPRTDYWRRNETTGVS